MTLRRGGKNTQKLWKIDLNDSDIHDGVITHLEPDILDCEVKWALGSITMNKVSGGDGIPDEHFKSWKMMLWKCCTQYASKYRKFNSGHRNEKGSFNCNIKEGQCKRMSKFSSDTQSFLTLYYPVDCSTPRFPVHLQLLSHSNLCHWLSDAVQSVHLYCPLLPLPSVFLRIRFFSNKSVLGIRWPKYWSFSFSISPSNEYSGLISFRMD